MPGPRAPGPRPRISDKPGIQPVGSRGGEHGPRLLSPLACPAVPRRYGSLPPWPPDRRAHRAPWAAVPALLAAPVVLALSAPAAVACLPALLLVAVVVLHVVAPGTCLPRTCPTDGRSG